METGKEYRLCVYIEYDDVSPRDWAFGTINWYAKVPGIPKTSGASRRKYDTSEVVVLFLYENQKFRIVTGSEQPSGVIFQQNFEPETKESVRRRLIKELEEYERYLDGSATYYTLYLESRDCKDGLEPDENWETEHSQLYGEIRSRDDLLFALSDFVEPEYLGKITYIVSEAPYEVSESELANYKIFIQQESAAILRYAFPEPTINPNQSTDHEQQAGSKAV